MLKKFIMLFALIMLTVSSVNAADNEDLNFEPLATTYSENNSASLTLVKIKDDDSIFFAVADSPTSTMAFVKYSPELYNFYLKKSEYGYPPLIFTMMIPMQERGQLDDNLGAWDNSVHLIPVYALFNVENGQVICDKPFFSADSLESTHFHDTVQNPNHTRLIEIFMTHMPRLHEEVNSKSIVLP